MDSESETMRDKSLEVALVVEKDIKPYEELFIKCKEDWIHHLAQALAFSSLTALVPNVILVTAAFGVILDSFGTQVRQMLTVNLEASIPSPLSSSVAQALGQALGTF